MGSMVLLDLMGGVALLLWGLHMVLSGVLRACGPDLRRAARQGAAQSLYRVRRRPRLDGAVAEQHRRRPDDGLTCRRGRRRARTRTRHHARRQCRHHVDRAGAVVRRIGGGADPADHRRRYVSRCGQSASPVPSAASASVSGSFSWRCMFCSTRSLRPSRRRPCKRCSNRSPTTRCSASSSQRR